MPSRKPRRTRNPAATREALLVAARTLLARDGPDGVSLSAVAQLAGVNRGTAYQRFATRENLVKAALESVSNELFVAAFGDPEVAATRPVGQVDILTMTTKLAEFAVNNPELCRIWFLQLLASENPDEDRFIHHYLESFRRFAATDKVVPGTDSEIVSLTMLASNFLWPVWSKAHARSEQERNELVRRYVDETLRMSLFGTIRAAAYPELAARLDGDLGEPLQAVAARR